jgi:Flp pilus assembly protein TadG
VKDVKGINRFRLEKGNYLLFYALLLPVIIGILALMIDLSGYWYTYAEAQKAVDAAAVAGAQGLDLEIFFKKNKVQLDPGTAPGLAGQYMSANAAGSVQLVSVYASKEQIWVVGQASYHSIFGGIFGAGTMTVTVSSSAVPEWGIDAIEQ